MPTRLEAVRHRTRDAVRIGVRSARADLRARTGRAGSLPDFVIAGAQRCGTTSLYLDLLRHPQVVAPLGKELQYFTLHHRRRLDWYRGHFPVLGPGQQTFEASPYYLFHPHAPERFARALPTTTQVVVVLRDPVERAVSHHLHSVRTGAERLGFADAVAAEPARLRRARALGVDSPAAHRVLRRHSYVARGMYGEQLARWHAAVGAERVHVLRSEDLHADPAPHYARLLDSLGLTPFTPDSFARHTRRRPGPVAGAAGNGAGDPRTSARRLLAGVFDADTARLLRLTGWSTAWPAS